MAGTSTYCDAVADGSAKDYDKGAWFVFDGGCPVCSYAAHALRIREAFDGFTLVDARAAPDHPLVREISAAGLDLDAGMVFRVAGVNHHGEAALQMMALLGSDVGWFNRMNAFLFKSRVIARLAYPMMRAARNLLIRLKGISKIDNLRDTGDPQPIFRAVFGDRWASLPAVFRDHYAVREASDDRVRLSGHLDVEAQWGVRLAARVTGMLVPYVGKNVPVTVDFTAGDRPRSLIFDRTFHFPGKAAVRFRSSVEALENGDCVEIMKFGLGWRSTYCLEGANIVLRHRGYVWRIASLMVPLPLTWLLGKGSAEERPLGESEFAMAAETVHPWFGKTFGYAGVFKITKRITA